MATVRTVTVKSSSGDYTSLSNAEAGEQGDLPTLDRQLNIECYSMEDTAAVVIDGWTTDATRYISIYVPSAERHDGKWNTNKYRLSPSNATVLTISEGYVNLRGLQLYLNSLAGNGNVAILISAGTYHEISDLLVRGDSTETYWSYLVSISSAATVKMWNSAIYGIATTNVDNTLIRSNNASAVLNIYSCTLSGGYYGLENNNGTVVAKNSYSGGASRRFYGTITKTTCASSDTTGSTGLQNIALDATNFTNVTAGSEDFHLPLGSALINVGTDTSGDAAPLNFTTDIDGQTRSGTWDIGADEYVAASSYIPYPFSRGARGGIAAASGGLQ